MAAAGMTRAALAALAASAAQALSLEARGGCGAPSMDFAAYVEKYGRSYQAGTEEYGMRQGVFERRAARISGHNCNPESLHTAEINHLSDWTPQELATLRGHKSRRGGRAGSALGGAPFLLAERGRGMR